MGRAKNRGRRYDEEPKLNKKKVFAVILAIIVIIMFIYIIKGFFDKKEEEPKITSHTYFTIYKDEKWGVIDETGNIVIDPSYAEMIIIPNAKMDVFLCTYDVNYTTGEYKTKALNSQNQEIFTEYANIEAISNKDESNTIWYEGNALKIQKEGKYGLINFEGKTLLQPEYEEITSIKGIENAIKVKKDGKYGIVGNDGKIVVEPKYKDIAILGKDNKSGYIIQEENDLFGLIDYSQNIILEAKYKEITNIYGNDMYVVKEGTTQKIVGKDGTDILTTGFDEITEILESKENGIIFKQNGKYGVMKTDGTITLKPEYEDLKEAKSGILIAKKTGKYGIIDIEGNQKAEFKYTNIKYQKQADIYIAENENFEADILDNTFTTKLTGMVLDCNIDKGYLKMLVNNETKYYTFKFEEKQDTEILINNTLFVRKKDGKYGFVDKQGNIVIDYIYDEATEQNSYGYAGIKKDGKWGVIDSKGNIIQEPTYDLENYLLVDFIGRWHLGQDINMNYYNQI